MKKILFVCVENSSRSQMAEAFANFLGKGIVEAYSAGSRPSGAVNESAIKVMHHAGIDISHAKSKGFDGLPIKEFDYVITMGCKDTCPIIPAKKHMEWDIEDPKGKGIDVFINVRDVIKNKVREFIEEISSEKIIVRPERKMERHFDEELEKMNTSLLKMASLTEEAIHKSIEALKAGNKKMAEAIIKDDTKIDEMELVIEEMAIDLLALRQPIAGDLRFITTGMKINAELERIADLAVNISQRVLELADQPLLKPLIDIPKLSSIAKKMVKEAIDAFVSRDESLAKKIILSDSEADRLRNLVYEELISDYMVKDGTTATRAVPLLLIARHLERICDHATNIAEDVIYMVKAKIVKHHIEELKNNPT